MVVQSNTAYVILGGGVHPLGSPKRLTQERAHAINTLAEEMFLHGETLPYFIFCGGKGYRNPVAIRGVVYPIDGKPESWEEYEQVVTEARAMEELFNNSIPPGLVLREEYSQSTIQNAFFIFTLFATPLSLERLVLVTHDWHRERALLCFEKARQFLLPPVALDVLDLEILNDAKVQPERYAAQMESEKEKIGRIGTALNACKCTTDYLSLIYSGSWDLSLGRFDRKAPVTYKPDPPNHK